MRCVACQAENEDTADVCFRCGKSLFALTEGALLGNRYEVLSPLGKGGMGMVYKAYDREFEEHVAIKVLRADLACSPDTEKRFRTEGKLARKVSHRNVCRIHEYARDGHRSYIVMELVEGMDFKRILRERGPLPPPEAYDVAISVAGALEAIHEAGIVHRDLKTPNIMRDASGAVKLMDFGIAKDYDSGTTGATLTGRIVGTPEYMSPEQARGEKLDARSDIYALGIVTFELFTGDVPFRGDTPVIVLFKHIQDPPPLRAVALPEALVPVLERALAKTPNARFATANEMAEALRNARALWVSPIRPARILGAVVPDELETEPVTTPVPTPTPVAATAAASHLSTPPAARSTPRVPATPQPLVARRTSRQVVAPPPRSQIPRLPTPRPHGRLGLAAGSVALAGLGLLAWMKGPGLPWLKDTATAVVRPPPPVVGTSSPVTPAPEGLPIGASPVSTNTPTPTWLATARAPAAPPASLLARPQAGPPPPVASQPPRLATALGRPASNAPSASASVAAPAPRAVAPQTVPARDQMGRTPDGEVKTPGSPPRATAASQEEHGTLRISVVPWAEVEVDGVKRGTSPPLKPLDLPPGDHDVRLLHPDYAPFRRRITVQAGEATLLDVNLPRDAFPR